MTRSFRFLNLLGLVGALLVLSGAPAVAAEAAGHGPSETLMLAQVVILVVLGRLLGEVMFRLGQPTIIGEILAGLLLGPSLLSSVWPQFGALMFHPDPAQNAMINGLSQLGILFLLLLAGMETDLGLAWRLRRKAVTVSLAGIAVPFAIGFGVAMLVPEGLLPDGSKRLVAALFIGTALSISSLKIVATVVREMNFLRRDIGQLIVASAVIDDTAGWVIIGITLGIATTGSIALGPLALSVVGTAIFMAVALTVGRRAAFELIRWTNDNLHSDLPVTSTIVALMGVLALITAGIGVQTVLGAFVAGLLIGQSPILTRQIDEQLRGLTTALFMPVFFGLTGLHTDLRVLLDPATAALAAGLIVIASLGKFGGAFLGAKLNGMSRKEALALGLGMNARGSTEVIVATIGLSVGVLDQRLFSVIVTMALVTTLIMPPTLRWALARLPIKTEEKERLEREQFEQDSYVSKLERILLVADQSASGTLAAVLAGHLGGLRNMPVTVLRSTEAEGDDKADDATERVRAASEESIAKAKQNDETREGTIHVAARWPTDGDLAESIKAEADKGHDLMFLGVGSLNDEEVGYGDEVRRALDAFKEGVAIVAARGGLRRIPDGALRMLVPVAGDNRSMRSVELATLIAKASGGNVSAIYVRPEGEGATRTPEQIETIFERVREIGKHYEVQISTYTGNEGQRELAILSRARRGRHNLLVLGTSRRASDTLSLGSLADTLLESSDRAILFFVTS
ncbi:MAG TPA: cation:proton antiporter [Hyphomicrobiaceae bacterium]|nr:cation:proton antiporter [Hyphomicrobiaceae bacterium]